jgi:Arc/MetJ family transcription regulator
VHPRCREADAVPIGVAHAVRDQRVVAAQFGDDAVLDDDGLDRVAQRVAVLSNRRLAVVALARHELIRFGVDWPLRQRQRQQQRHATVKALVEPYFGNINCTCARSCQFAPSSGCTTL